jgi:thioredoxin 1
MFLSVLRHEGSALVAQRSQAAPSGWLGALVPAGILARLDRRNNMSVTVLNDDNFEAEILNSDVPALVDFYATWCGPCKALSPIVEKLAEEYEGKLKVGKLNIDDSPNTPGQFSVRAVPTLVFFKGKEAVGQTVGLKTEADLRGRIEALM